MNIFQRFAEFRGSLRGHYNKGLEGAFSLTGAKADVSDQSAWIDPYLWGAGLLGSKKPSTKRQFVNEFRQWVYIAIRTNSQTAAMVPLRLYTTKTVKGKALKWAGGDELVPVSTVSKEQLGYLSSKAGLQRRIIKAAEIEEVLEHPYLDLMKNFNQYKTRMEFWELTITYTDLVGEAYWYLDFNRAKVPEAIYIVPSQFVEPVYGKTRDDAITGYKYEQGSVREVIPAENIIQFAYPNPHNPFTGFSMVRGIADAIYTQTQMSEFEAALFENRARPGGILSPKGNISKVDRDRLQKQFEQKFKGSARAGRTLVLPKDTDYTRDTMTPEELSFIEGSKNVRTTILAANDIPEGVIITESSNRAVAEAAEYRHAKGAIKPRLTRLEEKMNERLVPLYGDNLFVAFDDVVPKNQEFLLKERESNLKTAFSSINQERAKVGDEPVEWGDEPILPMNMVPLGSAPAEPTPIEDEEQTRKFTKRVMEIIKEEF